MNTRQLQVQSQLNIPGGNFTLLPVDEQAINKKVDSKLAEVDTKLNGFMTDIQEQIKDLLKRQAPAVDYKGVGHKTWNMQEITNLQLQQRNKNWAAYPDPSDPTNKNKTSLTNKDYDYYGYFTVPDDGVMTFVSSWGNFYLVFLEPPSLYKSNKIDNAEYRKQYCYFVSEKGSSKDAGESSSQIIVSKGMKLYFCNRGGNDVLYSASFEPGSTIHFDSWKTIS